VTERSRFPKNRQALRTVSDDVPLPLQVNHLLTSTINLQFLGLKPLNVRGIACNRNMNPEKSPDSVEHRSLIPSPSSICEMIGTWQVHTNNAHGFEPRLAQLCENRVWGIHSVKINSMLPRHAMTSAKPW
jgi:hypothetical protein